MCVCVLLQQEKPKLIDPLDYEAVIAELTDDLKDDPLRDLLLFPVDDFTVSLLFFSEIDCSVLTVNFLDKVLLDSPKLT